MITEFRGEYRFLSNFWPSPVTMVFTLGKMITLPTVEHAYQASKAPRGHYINFQRDTGLLVGTYREMTPGQATRAGRQVRLRPTWHEVRVNVMLGLLQQKYAAGTTLAEMLLATGDQVIEEGNTWGDSFWGVYQGYGLNTLGKLLMQVRRELRESGA